MTQSQPAWNPWPAAIIGWFVIFFTGIVIYTTWSIRQRVDLVGVDYYDQEIRFQQRLDSVNRTQRVANGVSVTFADATRQIVIALPVEHAARHPAGSIHLYRPSDARLDHRFKLALNADGRQTVEAAALSPGLWKVRVAWTVGGEEFFRDETVVIPAAKP
jgi:nitrogen fixation protein FixH